MTAGKPPSGRSRGCGKGGAPMDSRGLVRCGTIRRRTRPRGSGAGERGSEVAPAEDRRRRTITPPDDADMTVSFHPARSADAHSWRPDVRTAHERPPRRGAVVGDSRDELRVN